MECSRKRCRAESLVCVAELEVVCVACGFMRPLCARKDSRPEEKAKDPRGRAESESRRREWRAGFIGEGEWPFGRVL